MIEGASFKCERVDHDFILVLFLTGSDWVCCRHGTLCLTCIGFNAGHTHVCNPVSPMPVTPTLAIPCLQQLCWHHMSATDVLASHVSCTCNPISSTTIVVTPCLQVPCLSRSGQVVEVGWCPMHVLFIYVVSLTLSMWHTINDVVVKCLGF